MSVLCCRVPNFLVGLATRQNPEWGERPLALLGADGQVWAASPEARQSGVYAQMSARQAQTRCPDVLLRPLDAQQCEAEQGALLGTLAQSGLPVEARTWGTAYVDLQQVASGDLPVERLRRTVQPLCAELGKKIQELLGETLWPALGWDSSKFTARAAAGFAKPGHMRLVAHTEEMSVLNPLPIQLLPLPWTALQQLDWLGIRTLGQFARLPAAAVGQRFGPAGRVAQQWAQGRDKRPVCANTRGTPEPLCLEFEPPSGDYLITLATMLAALQAPLDAWAVQLAGCRHLRLDLCFTEGSTRAIDCTFIEPVTNGSRLRATLSHRLQTLNWPAELSAARLTLLESGELTTKQLTLFEMKERPSPVPQLAQKLSGRYGSVFYRGQIDDAQHPLAERRAAWQSFASAVV
jgi:nucleotidyltransferase/DNA polymerase involved in DNA repair